MLILTQKQPATVRLDFSSIQPIRLAKMSLTQIAAMPLQCGNRSSTLADWFQISGSPSEHIRIELKELKLDNVAQDMRGGTIHVSGDVGHAAGAGMLGGRVIIEGNAGDRTAAISPVSGAAMRGGVLMIGGNAGDFLAQRMRRGVIYVRSDAGCDGADRMIAGTIVAMGQIGDGWADGMKRGSIILPSQPNEVSPKWKAKLSDSSKFELSFLPILWNYLRDSLGDLDWPVPTTSWAARQVGDLAVHGQGEVLTV